MAVQRAQGSRLQGVPVVNVIVVTSAQDVAATQRERTGCKGTASRSAVLGHLLVRADVKETRRFILAARGECESIGVVLGRGSKLVDP